MDVKEFLKEWQRMCNSREGECPSCPVVAYCHHYRPLAWNEEANSSMSIDDFMSKIEKWVKEHPRKTRLDDLKEKYPNVLLDDKKYPYLPPLLLGYCKTKRCCDCPCYADWNIKDCWNAEIEEYEK